MKSTYIFGAGYFGVLTALVCEIKGIKVAGFIDNYASQIKTRLGLPVFEPNEITNNINLDYRIIFAVDNENILSQLVNSRLVFENIIRNYFVSLNPNEQEHDIQEIIEYFKENPFNVFPYAYTKKYNNMKIDVFYDKTCDMNYIFHKDKKMYFPKKVHVPSYYTRICLEQDEASPHRYETEHFTVKNGDVIADIGAAEGVWALLYTETAKKIYLFECDADWIQALKKTFEPWKEKTVIVNKYISNISEGNYITLDDFFQNETLNFIKADIEGMETKLLEGAAKILAREKDLKLLLCAYHRQNDAYELKKRLDELGFNTEYSKRYMLFIYDNDLNEPYARRGLVRATTHNLMPKHNYGACVIMCIFGISFTKVYNAPMNYDSYCFTNNKALQSEVEKKGWKYIFVDFPLSEDYSTSSFQSKYIKFLQFLKEDIYSYFMKYDIIVYKDHKLNLKDEHIKYLIETIDDKKILIRNNPYNRKNIAEEIQASMNQNRYLKFMPQTIDYVLEKTREGYSAEPTVVWTALIAYKHKEKDVIDFTDKVYNDLKNIGTSQCQIIWSMLGQKYEDIIKIIKWNEVEVEWKNPE